MNKTEAYKWAIKRIRAQVLRHQDETATLANTCAILKEFLSDYFWVGIYYYRGDHLLLGPFQGPPACVILSIDKGVCAESVKQKGTVLVRDVEQFPGHIACDSRSKSEIVVPLYTASGEIKAVLDVDSDKLAAFDETDQTFLEQIAALLKEIL
ncbi:MAG: GAF domain-containing protein [candidate division KSB1 bacterium]|nr:GAF domain-containing protein [candidate division KSB1 bacterium]